MPYSVHVYSVFQKDVLRNKVIQYNTIQLKRMPLFTIIAIIFIYDSMQPHGINSQIFPTETHMFMADKALILM